MREHGLAAEAVVEQGDLTEEGGYRATVRLLSARERPTAVFAFNDIACVGALSAAEELGLQVPRDLSLVGYDNTYLSRLRHLWLTTVDSAAMTSAAVPRSVCSTGSPTPPARARSSSPPCPRGPRHDGTPLGQAGAGAGATAVRAVRDAE